MDHSSDTPHTHESLAARFDRSGYRVSKFTAIAEAMQSFWGAGSVKLPEVVQRTLSDTHDKIEKQV